MAIASGTRLGRYEIRSQIGAGGMGEVYLAQDTKLERTVALKILPADVASDQARMRRFIQEARAASGLSHPNVAHIYEIEEQDGYHFIAMEYIEGETLRRRLSHTRLDLTEALDISLQAGAALAAAHAAGIVHRDIKPDNIMLRTDGYAKVLDFGLAKLTDKRGDATDTEAPTRALVNTDPGMVMGTAAYMSPEQARGQEIDARTDVWSLGVVLYEMIAGRTPFEGSSVSDVISAILNKEPPPLARYARDVPEALEMIVQTTLTKDKEERYHSIKEMMGALRRVKQRLDAAAEIERSAPPDGEQLHESLSQRSVVGGSSRDQRAVSTAPEIGRSSQIDSARTASSAEYLVAEIKRHKTGIVFALLGLALLAGALVTGLYFFVWRKASDQTARTTNTRSSMKIVRLTTSGKVDQAAVSPDGKYVIYSVRDGGQESLWMRQVATGSNAQIVAPAKINIGRQTFSPDGNYVYYPAWDESNPSGALFQVATLGGVPRRILANIGSCITFSPDGNRIAFLRNDNAASGEDQLIVANADGTNERKLTARKGDVFFTYGGPAWSPDGKVIASAAGSYKGGFHSLVLAIDAETGEQREFSPQKYMDTGRISWLADGSGMVMNGSEGGLLFDQIWLISYPGGEAQQITHDLNYYNGTTLTADSRSLVTVQLDETANVWVAPSSDLTRGKQITTGKLEGLTNMAWTPDGKIVFTSTQSGNMDIWIMSADGTNQKQLTTDPQFDQAPTVSPDGRFIVFVSWRAGFPSLWRMDIDGGNLKQLTNNQEDYGPQITPDGQWILFRSWRTARQTLWKMPVDGGDPVQISDLFVIGQGISPDGKLIACIQIDEKPNMPRRLLILPFAGGTPVKSFDLPPTVDPSLAAPRWTPDGLAVTLVDTRTGTPNLWSQSLDGGPLKQLTDFKPDGILSREWSRDGKLVALTRGAYTSDVVLISDFR